MKQTPSEERRFRNTAWISLGLACLALVLSLLVVLPLDRTGMDVLDRSSIRILTRILVTLSALWTAGSVFWVLESYHPTWRKLEKKWTRNQGLKDVKAEPPPPPHLTGDPPIGKRGVVTSALRPNGRVKVDGQELDARCDCGLLEVGEPVIVTGTHAFGLVVRAEKDPAKQSP